MVRDAEVDMPGPEGAPMAFYQGDQGTMLFIYQRSTPTKADHTVAGWIVEDTAWFTDPDGNILSLAAMP